RVYSTPLFAMFTSLHSARLPFPFLCPHTAAAQLYPLSLHDALPISRLSSSPANPGRHRPGIFSRLIITRSLRQDKTGNYPQTPRSEEHTSELQSRFDLVCRLLLEKKKRTIN